MRNPREPGFSAGEPLQMWEGEPTVRLAREWGIPELHVYRSVGSTNDIARRLAATGSPAGTCVLAEEQTAGRGRASRRWLSPPGLGIWLSMVVRPRETAVPDALPLVVGLGVARALDPFCAPHVPQIKWPNDILLLGRKLGGILCEGSWEGNRLRAVIVGIGLNILHTPADFPPELAASATSLCTAVGAIPSRIAVAGAVVREVGSATPSWALEETLLDELRRRDALLGSEIEVDEADGEPLRGTACGISAAGSLVVRTSAGEVCEIRSGSVRRVESLSPDVSQAVRPAGSGRRAPGSEPDGTSRPTSGDPRPPDGDASLHARPG